MQQLEEQLSVLQKNFAAVMSENLQRTHEVDDARAAAKADVERASQLHGAALGAAEEKAQAHAGEVQLLHEAIADLKAKHAVEARSTRPRATPSTASSLPPLPALLRASHIALHPAPCTLLSAPCTLHPAPCTLHLAPCSLPGERDGSALGPAAAAVGCEEAADQ